jgi:hypothetical protein
LLNGVAVASAQVVGTSGGASRHDGKSSMPSTARVHFMNVDAKGDPARAQRAGETTGNKKTFSKEHQKLTDSAALPFHYESLQNILKATRPRPCSDDNPVDIDCLPRWRDSWQRRETGSPYFNENISSRWLRCSSSVARPFAPP